MNPVRLPVGPGQESVWDYPRPPAVVRSEKLVWVVFGGVELVRTREAWRLLETSHPPTWYLPRSAFREGALRPASGSSYCEWKGSASYFDLTNGERVAPKSAWTNLHPTPAYAVLKDHIALYASAVDGCFVEGEQVVPQPGGFYGGWITKDVVGPFKGGPGSMGW